jgi:tRNA-2-methylthio-N6-dimethylallyladenosine synthase
MKSHDHKSAYIKTFGCQMNEHDSGKISILLESLGYRMVETPEAADLVLYNTCTIREKAHHKAISEIGRAKFYKHKNPDVIVGVCGCVASQDGEELFKTCPHLDIVFGPDQIHALPDLLKNAAEKKRAGAVTLVDAPADYVFPDFVDEKKRFKASEFVSIMKGCNCACSYCIVPKVRGREVCRPPDEIVSEIARLVRAGTKEVVLLGQNVNAYQARRSRAGGEMNFSGLLKKISLETEISRMRFASPHPKDVTDELIALYACEEKLCPHIHLPVQSGSTSVLKRMRRGYTREKYLETVEGLRNAKPGISITTDIIVGFCGETEAEFQDTLDMLYRVRFDSIFAFKYSSRAGTEAACDMNDDVSQKEKERRLELILEFQKKVTLEKNEALIGSVQNALVFGTDRMKKGLLTGRIADNRITHFAGHERFVGDIVPVRIIAANKNSLSAEVV